jgi:hypothetical protein
VWSSARPPLWCRPGPRRALLAAELPPPPSPHLLPRWRCGACLGCPGGRICGPVAGSGAPTAGSGSPWQGGVAGGGGGGGGSGSQSLCRRGAAAGLSAWVACSRRPGLSRTEAGASAWGARFVAGSGALRVWGGARHGGTHALWLLAEADSNGGGCQCRRWRSATTSTCAGVRGRWSQVRLYGLPDSGGGGRRSCAATASSWRIDSPRGCCVRNVAQQ